MPAKQGKLIVAAVTLMVMVAVIGLFARNKSRHMEVPAATSTVEAAFRTAMMTASLDTCFPPFYSITS